MLEVEVKFSVAEFAPLEAKLREWRATFDPARRDEDRYFNAAGSRLRDHGRSSARSLGRCEERRDVQGPEDGRGDEIAARNRIRTRRRRRSSRRNGAHFDALGYRATGVVRKSRRIARLRRDGFELQASLDEVDGVGRYAEVETMAEEARFAEAKAAVLSAAAELGMTQPERRSYLQLMLERQPTEKR